MNRDRFETAAAQWNFNPVIIEMFRVFAEQLHENVKLTDTMNLLDVGGGTGLIAFDLAPSVQQVTIVDSSPAMVKAARERLPEAGVDNVTIVESDIVHADLPAEQFDAVYAHMSLHHIENIDTAFKRFAELVKTGGSVIIGDLTEEDGSFHGDDPVPHNGFNTDELKKLCRENGFDSVSVQPLQEVTMPGKERSYERFLLIAKRS